MEVTSRRAIGRGQRTLAPVIGVTGALALVGVGLAWAAYVRRYVLHDLPLTAALSGELHAFTSTAGHLAYYSGGALRRGGPLGAPNNTPPLLFIHSVGAAPSSYEMKPLYEHYARERKVYSLDLPGFGFSERGNRRYSPQLYQDAINDFIAKELRGGAVDAVALSLSCEFLALAATARPAHFRTLTFISPTGMSRHSMRVRARDGLLRLLLNPSWSRLLYDTVTSRPGIRAFINLAQARGAGRAFTHYAYLTSHQPGAHYAPFYFLAGKLFTPSVFMAFQALRQPSLLVYGRSATTKYDMVDVLHEKPNWRIVQFTRCGDLVHWDDSPGVIAQMDQLFARA